MKAHDLAQRLLRGPDLEVELEYSDDFGVTTDNLRTLGRDPNAVILSVFTAHERRRHRAEEKRAHEFAAKLAQQRAERDQELQEKWGPLLP